MYKYALETKNSTPEESVILTLMFLHFMQLLMVAMIATSIMPKIYSIINPENKIGVVAFLMLFYFVFRKLIYNKSKWLSYIEKFKSESPSEKRKGFWKVFIYIAGTIFLFFLPVLIRLWMK